MMIKKLLQQVLLVLLVTGSISACKSKVSGDTKNAQDQGAHDSLSLHLQVDPNTVYQTIDNFGASDAWTTQFIGKWPEEKKEAIADLLFSQDFDADNNPAGIGLSLWRFNVGAGSAQQGEDSGIRDEWRRAESFLEASGDYNWENQAGQVWFAKAARDHGVENLLIFSNSPPVTMTRNARAFANNGTSNLAPENYGNFAAFLTRVAQGLESKGLQVNYISPVNEPQWDWSDGGQEGTPFWNHEIAGIVRALNAELSATNLAAKIDIPEAAQLNYLYEAGNKEGRGNHIEAFYDSSSEHYIGDLEHLSRAVSGHSYFTTSPFSKLVDHREKLSRAVAGSTDLKFWMSEYCILGDNDGEIEGNGRDLGIDPALYIARVIHADLAIAQASAWHWWLAVSSYDYKDGLVYVDHQKADGDFYPSKMLWALGNYSRFIRPGFQRISVEAPEMESRDLLFSAYKSPDSSELVVVLVNSADHATEVRLSGLGQQELKNSQAYITSSEKDLEFQSVDLEKAFSVPARSIVTITNQTL